MTRVGKKEVRRRQPGGRVDERERREKRRKGGEKEGRKK